MAFPSRREIEDAILEELVHVGGQARPKDLYPRITARFPGLTEEEQREVYPGDPNTPRWIKDIQWTRLALVSRGLLDRSRRGWWIITEEGKAKVSGQVPPPDHPPPIADLQGLVAAHRKETRELLLKRLMEMHPKAFEHFCGELLRRIGFVEVEVTGYSADGGIDGQGVLRAGPITLKVAFQVKRWTNSVGVGPVGEFRGRLGAKFERLLFIATSKFTDGASELAKEPGAAPMILVGGDQLLDLMLEYGIGLNRLPLTMDVIDEDFFAKFDSAAQ